MSTRIVAANGVYDLSAIKSSAHLHEEIGMLKAAIKKQEHELGEHFRKMPQEVLKASADAFLPAFINKMIANTLHPFQHTHPHTHTMKRREEKEK